MTEVETRSKIDSADVLAASVLAGLLFCVYLVTASFTFLSGDELYLFDFTESIAKHQSVWRSETAELEWPGESITEPLQPLLAAPLYWLVNNQLEGVGNVHGTLLFNPIVTALTASLVFLYLRRLNFDRLTSLVSALAFGLTTLALPYTKTFFREPLTVFLLFACAFFLLSWREAVLHREYGKRIWLMLAIMAGLAGMVSKEAAALGAPLLILILLPWIRSFIRKPRDWLAVGIIFGIFVAIIFSTLWLISTSGILGGGRFDFIGRLVQMTRNISVAQQGLLGFLFSPGKSFFLYSPILLFALVAPFVSARYQKWDVSWPLIFGAIFIIVYAFGRGEVWFGGRNWGPRYLLPITPFLIISATPLIQIALHKKHWLPKIALAVVLISGVLVQIAGTTISLADYDEFLSKLAPGAPWTLAIWQPYYSPILGHWRMIGTRPFDFAWMQAASSPTWIYPILTLSLAAVFSATLFFVLTKQIKQHVAFFGIVVGFFLTISVTWFSLHSIYYDQRYQGDNKELHQLNDALRKIDAPDPVIFLNNHAYFNFMMNYYKGDLWWYTLELNPKELYQEGEMHYLPSIDPTTIANLNARSVVEHFGEERQTIYLIMEHSLYTPNSPRPLEWWMSYRYHYQSVQEFSTTVRLVRFSSVLAPKPEEPSAHPVKYQVGESVMLIGWDMKPEGVRLRPHSILNISTQWKTLNKPDGDYKIAMYLMNPSGAIALQDDSIPLNTFWPSISWNTGDTIRHNIAFTIPKDVLPGFYEVWAVMYNANNVQRLLVQDPSRTTIRDYIVLTTVEITR